ncbi:hypothetical protein MUCCIDRAFT_81690 [Mucor lusitanicus CBS 277.49]|uniref:Uncharacterized protein n=1 Tax=Mucor lusitanicus CBS 277.49 TaxID=747725 RepID=A0A168LM96_MUCCL|nr:hypothetical protein MUCCIDRAFT_81690 [Mucor lusitanicus CBS 277.49]
MTLASRPFIFNIAITLVVLFLFTACVSANIATNIIDRSSNSTQQLVTRQNNGYANITAYLHNIRGMDFSTSCSKSAGNDMTQCDFYFNPNKLAYWEQPTVCVIYGYIRPMRDLEACIMQVPENPCLMKYMDWLQQCARDIYFAGTFLLNHTRVFQGNTKMKSVKIPTKNLIDPRQIVFESYGHLFTGVFKSAPTSKGNATVLH